MKPKFRPGRIVATPAAHRALDRFNVSYRSLLQRHLAGDWGNLGRDDTEASEEALMSGQARLMSAYTLRCSRFEVEQTATVIAITEADRSQTTFLLLSER
jgi:hypothetical protein